MQESQISCEATLRKENRELRESLSKHEQQLITLEKENEELHTQAQISKTQETYMCTSCRLVYICS